MSVEFICDNDINKPTRGTSLSVGWDLKCPTSVVLKANTVTKIELDLKLEMSNDIWGHICDRSSMGKRGIHVFGGVVDPDYKGKIGVLLYNTNHYDYHIESGERIAQLVFHYIVAYKTDDDNIQVRGQGGFGSTGK